MMYRPSTRESILDAARIEMINEGYAGASMRSIATRAYSTTGAIYGHFNNKADLYRSLIKPIRADFYNYLARQSIQDHKLVSSVACEVCSAEYCAPHALSHGSHPHFDKAIERLVGHEEMTQAKPMGLESLDDKALTCGCGGCSDGCSEGGHDETHALACHFLCNLFRSILRYAATHPSEMKLLLLEVPEDASINFAQELSTFISEENLAYWQEINFEVDAMRVNAEVVHAVSSVVSTLLQQMVIGARTEEQFAQMGETLGTFLFNGWCALIGSKSKQIAASRAS